MSNRVFTVPNQLTLLRLGFLPFFVIFIYYGRYRWALVLLVAAAVSDALDGLLARRLDQKTPLGALLDPIADKLLISSSFFILALKQQVEWWLAILVLSRDLLILVTAAVVLAVAGYRPLPPTLYGKITTGAQIILVVLVLADEAFANTVPAGLRLAGNFVVAASTILSGLHYSVVVARRLSA